MIRYLLAALLFVITSYPASAEFANTTVPVSACNPSAGSVQACYAATPPPAPPVTSATSAPVVVPSTQIPQGVFAHISTTLLDRTEQGISKGINASIYVAQWLFIRIAAISTILALLGWYLEGESVARLIKIAYWRMIETFLWLTMISWTWKGPGGILGWFPAIIGGIAAIGGQIADQIAGTQIATFTNYDFNFTVLPGTILDLGGALFGAIATLAWATFAGGVSTAPGWGSVAANAIQGTIAVVGGALTGTLFISGILYCLMMLSAVYVYFVCGWIAWRYFLSVMRVFLLACLAFLQGFGASRRLSGYAGGFVSIAIVLGAEFALTTIIVGIFYGVVVGIIQTTPIWPLISSLITNSGGVVAAAIAWPKEGISLGYLLLIDMVITAWAYAMRDVPKSVSDFFAGRLSIDPQGAVRSAQSSPTIGGKILGAAGGAMESFAYRGPAQTADSQAAQVAKYGFIGASTSHRGTAYGVATGAVRGGMVGGFTGAVAGAAGSWIAGRFIPKKEQESSAGEGAPSTAPNEATSGSAPSTSGETAASSTASPASSQSSSQTEQSAQSTNATQSEEGKTSSSSSSTGTSSSGASSGKTSTAPNAARPRPDYSSVLHGRDLGKYKHGGRVTIGDIEFARGGSESDPPGVKQTRSFIGSLINPELMKELDEIDKRMSFGATLARHASYAAQYRETRKPSPPREEPSASIPPPNLHFRG